MACLLVYIAFAGPVPAEVQLISGRCFKETYSPSSSERGFPVHGPYI